MRLIHGPTDIRVEARNERSQYANKEAAFKHLQAKLDKMLEDRAAAMARVSYEAKPETGFGSQIRTVRLVGKDQGVIDHITGESCGNPISYLAGNLDRFIMARLRSSNE